MDWVNNVIIPVCEVIGLFLFLAFLLFMFVKFGFDIWLRWIGPFIKYRIFGKKITDWQGIKETAGLTDEEVATQLLISGYTKKDIYEFIYLKHLGGKNDRQTKKYDR